MRLRIAQAMMWKYGVACSKNKKGDDIDKWESNTVPKPSKSQVKKDVAAYEKHDASKVDKKEVAKDELEAELAKPAGNAFKVLRNLRILGKI